MVTLLSDTHLRSIVKAFSWRISASLLTLIISYIFTLNIVISSGIAVTEFIMKIIWYYIHERIWNAIKWGTNM